MTWSMGFAARWLTIGLAIALGAMLVTEVAL